MNSLLLAANAIVEAAQSVVPTASDNKVGESSNEKQTLRALEEDELAARARAKIDGKEEFYIYDDFDGDGLSEAFYCVSFTAEGKYKYWRHLYLYFIDSYGNISEVDWHFDHKALIFLDYPCASTEIMEFGTTHFLIVNYNSQSTTGGTDLISVHNGQAYAPEGMQALISIKKGDAFSGDTFDLQTISESGGLQNYLFDESSGEFILQN